MITSPAIYTLQQLTSDQFEKFSSFISQYYGIKMPEVKKTTLQCRLQRRLKKLQIDNFDDYMEYVFSKEGQKNELVHMMNEVSTNKTDFYREIDHFNQLSQHILSELTADLKSGGSLSIWSAGCSSGEEAYTIAFTMEEFIETHCAIDYKIYGTDISTKVIKQATDAIYQAEKVEVVPQEIKKKYLLRNKNREIFTVRVKPNIREKVSFSRLNFMDNHYNVPRDMDIIFCRNVLIYFDAITQKSVLQKMISKLKKGGYLFIGHSESLTNMDLPLDRIKPTIFKKR
jgi:chemotaxis protein methyltransferase CheR